MLFGYVMGMSERERQEARERDEILRNVRDQEILGKAKYSRSSKLLSCFVVSHLLTLCREVLLYYTTAHHHHHHLHHHLSLSLELGDSIKFSTDL